MMILTLYLLVASFLLQAHLALFQQIVSNTTIITPDFLAACSPTDQGNITNCLRQVDNDELTKFGMACQPPNWPCEHHKRLYDSSSSNVIFAGICEKQQGKLDCYTFSLKSIPLYLTTLIGQECAGSHGRSSKIRSEGGNVAYTWSSLPVPPTTMSPTLKHETTVQTIASQAGANNDVPKNEGDAQVVTETVIVSNGGSPSENFGRMKSAAESVLTVNEGYCFGISGVALMYMLLL